ncbi:g4566 [Coccomyxa elongata]
MSDFAAESVARRTRSSARAAGTTITSSKMEAAVLTPLPGDRPPRPPLSPVTGKAPSGRRIPISGNESNYTPLAQTVPASDRQEAVRQAASSTASAMEKILQALPKRYGPAVPPADHHLWQMAAKSLAAIAVLWIISILIGGFLHSEVHHGMETKTLQARLPLLWFDRLLRRHGPLLPLPVFAIRLAVDIAAVLSNGHNLQSPQGNRLRHHLAEAAVVYVGVTAVRLFVYGLHCAGVYRLLSRAGAVSAVPIQLMSDHIFLGASVVAILSAELVLLRCTLRQASCPVHVKTLARAGLLAAAALLVLTCGDMHFTARFFHERTETFLGAILGLLAFQIPITWWLLYGFSVS